MMSHLDKCYTAIIEKVIPPGADGDLSHGYQYQYQVLVNGDQWSAFRAMCVRMDQSAGRDYTEESILSSGLRVFVMFPCGSKSLGIILGCARQYLTPQDPGRGKYWARRFNLITETIEKDNTWQLKHDLGPFIKVEGRKVTVSDSYGNEVIVNAGTPAGGGSVDVNAGALNVTVKGDITVNATGDVNVKASNATVTAQNVEVKATSVKATVAGDVSLTATGNVDVKATSVNLNQVLGGEVLTTLSQPTCYVTGIPFVGVPTVKAG